MRELALFAGAGGGILGGHLLGWRTVCAVEWEPYAASVLAARQNDRLLPPFPIWDDVRTFDGHPWRGVVDVVSGGFPCQDISVAGKGAGIDGERSGMWSHMARIIGEVRPRFAFVENSPALITRGLGRVLGDLAALGYDCRAGVLGAADVGANHKRDRFWLVAADALHGGHRSLLQSIAEPWCGLAADVGSDGEAWAVADSHGDGQLQPGRTDGEEWRWIGDTRGDVSHTEHQRTRWRQQLAQSSKKAWGSDAEWWRVEPDVGRVADGVAARVDRLKAIGNGQVPLCAATAWRLLTAGQPG